MKTVVSLPVFLAAMTLAVIGCRGDKGDKNGDPTRLECVSWESDPRRDSADPCKWTVDTFDENWEGYYLITDMAAQLGHCIIDEPQASGTMPDWGSGKDQKVQLSVSYSIEARRPGLPSWIWPPVV